MSGARKPSVQIQHDDRVYTWSPETRAKIDRIIKRYPAGRQASAVIPVLKIAQDEFDGWLPTGLMNLVAETLNMPPIRVYEVATFYDMFFTEPVGKNVVRVCTNVSCMIRGSGKVLETVEREAGAAAGETSSDGLVTVQEFECMGACCEAPMMMVNNHYHVNLTPEKAAAILRDIKAGRVPEAPTK